MQQLGYSAWLYQTVGNVERGKRQVMAEEIRALALGLDTNIAALMGATDQDGTIELAGSGSARSPWAGQQVRASMTARLRGTARTA